MFYLNKSNELTVELLSKMINKFRLDIEPTLQKRKNYYDGNQAALKRSYSDDSKPCNKSVVNYCKNIADSYCGYLATPSYISYSSEQDIEDIMEVLRYNDYQAEDAAFLLDALVYGTAAELMFIDEQGQTRFKLISPLQCFGVYDDSLTSDLLYFVRMYKQNEWDNTDTYCIDVYSNFEVKHYTMQGKNGTPHLIEAEPHYFSQCPANIFTLPNEQGVFDCILTLQDTYNELLSAEVDDFSAFCDAYLTISAAELDEDTVKTMKENRVLMLPTGAQAAWLTKNANDAQVENILKRLHESIYRIAACPDFSSESFVGGVSSGIAIRYRLTGMETRAAKIAAEMKKALQRRVEIICGVAALKLGEAIFRDIQINFKRNIPVDLADTVGVVNKLKGSVSDKTLLGLLPFVDDINAELEALAEEKAANMELYSFPSFEEEADA